MHRDHQFQESLAVCFHLNERTFCIGLKKCRQNAICDYNKRLFIPCTYFDHITFIFAPPIFICMPQNQYKANQLSERFMEKKIECPNLNSL